MGLYPVIMCGGGGARLWPSSRPSRPKQFINLAGNRSLFQDTAERVAPLATDGGTIIVIGGVAHGATIADQLAQIGLEAQTLLEPQPRDSAAAMAAAAVWVARTDPRGVIAFVASDHYVPDASAFRHAVIDAAVAARRGRIVTLGIQPTAPSPAYGYVKPAAERLSPVEAFHEKPDASTAALLISAGYLWNSGNFIVSAETIIGELEGWAPEILAAATASLPSPDHRSPVNVLGESFLAAPKVSIDYAVMERTRLASVLPVQFAWSDLGAWDSIAVTGEGSTGMRILEDSERVLTRAPDGVLVAALGVSDVAIVVERDVVLVCDINRSQEVKGLVERVRLVSPRHLDFVAAPTLTLGAEARAFGAWLKLRALPVWSTLGLGTGGFYASLSLTGRPVFGSASAVVQTAQISAFAKAGGLGWQGPWDRIVQDALVRLELSSPPQASDGAQSEDNARQSDDELSDENEALVMSALATAVGAGIRNPSLAQRAGMWLNRERSDFASVGGSAGPGDWHRRSMLKLGTLMDWHDVTGDPRWTEACDGIVSAALERLPGVQAERSKDGFEAARVQGPVIETRGLFEWAGMLARYSAKRQDARSLEVSERLYAAGFRGIAHRPPVAVDAHAGGIPALGERASLVTQTIWLKASLLLSEAAAVDRRETYLNDAASALGATRLFLSDDGLWRNLRLQGGQFLEEAAEAASLDLLVGVFHQLGTTIAALELEPGQPLRLD